MSTKTRLARLKRHDPKRGFVLKRYTYRGVKFHVERGWVRVDLEMAEHLEGVREIDSDEHSPLAFDVCTDAEARRLDEEERREERPALATEAVRVAKPREPSEPRPPAADAAPSPKAATAKKG